MSITKAKTTVLEVPCEFGGISIGDATARLGVRINREHLNLYAADEAFCGHRLTGKVKLGAGDDAQATFVDDLDESVSGTFDVKRIGVSAEVISLGLTWSLKDIDIAVLSKFSKGSGRLVIYEVAALPDDSPTHDEDNESETLPGTLAADGPWRSVTLDRLFGGSILKSLKKAGLDSVGALADYSAGEKRLTDIDGIGPGKAEQIENRMLEFWRDNPQPDGVGA